IGCAQKPVLKRVQIERIAFGSNIAESARHQARTDVTDTGSNLQNVVAKMRPDGVRQPTHVLRCACQVVEESAAVLTDIRSSINQKRRITPRALTPSRQPIFFPSS